MRVSAGEPVRHRVVVVLLVRRRRTTEAAHALSAAISFAQTVVTFALPVALLRQEKKVLSCSPGE